MTAPVLKRIVPSDLLDPEDESIVWVSSFDALGYIASPGIRLAVLPRTVPPALARGLASTPPAALPQLRHTVSVSDLGGLPSLLAGEDKEKTRPEAASIAPLAADIVQLVRAFAAALGLTAVRIRLERVENDACRLFHADYVAARLIATYLGPTTQYLPEFALRRAGLGLGCNDGICRDSAAIRSVPPGAVAVFKGARGPEGLAGAAVHRSPPLSRRGQSRYVLVVDESA